MEKVLRNLICIVFIRSTKHIQTFSRRCLENKGMLNHNIIYEDIARYSVLHGNEQLFASKYKLYLPTEEELRAEIVVCEEESL